MTESNQTDTNGLSRRTALKGLGAGGLAALGGCVSAANNIGSNAKTSVDEWPQLQYDGAHTGTAPTSGPRNDVAIKWKYKMEPLIQSGPVVADGMVYATNWDYTIHAWDAETGELQWTFDDDGNTDWSPTVYDGTVYVAGQRGLHALDAKTGEERWNNGGGGVLATGVTVANGTLYFSPGPTRALDPETGEILWTYDGGSWAPLGVKNGRVFGGQQGGKKFALDAETGEELWTQNDSGAWDAPAVADGTVYWCAGKGLFAYDAETGEKAYEGRQFFHSNRENKEEAHKTDRMGNSPAVVDGTIYVGSYSEIFAIDAETGEVIWEHSQEDVGFTGTVGSAAVVDDIVYIGDLNGRMWGFNAETGETRFATRVSNAILNSPAVVNGNIYITSELTPSDPWGASGIDNPNNVKNRRTLLALEDPTA